MIPRIIHYCWFGGRPLPRTAQKCKDSWTRFFPDYEIREWNESNFDVWKHEYSKFCYEHKLWAYLSDYVRLVVVEEYGGLYFDTDVEVVRKPDELLADYVAYFGWETPEFVNTGLGFAAVPHHEAVRAMREKYDGLLVDGKYCYDNGKMWGCPQLNTLALEEWGLARDGSRQEVCGAEILPVDYLCPYTDATGELSLTDRTVSIHWFNKSPHGKVAVWRMKLLRPVRRLLKWARTKFACCHVIL